MLKSRIKCVQRKVGIAGTDYAPLRNFCFNGAIDLKFGMLIVLVKFLDIEKKVSKNCQEVAQNAGISTF